MRSTGPLRSLRVATGLLSASVVAATAGAVPGAPAAEAAQSARSARVAQVGPPYDHTTELKGDGNAIPLKDQAMLTRTEHGYLYQAGQQDSRMLLRLVRGGLKVVDRGTARFKELAEECQEKPAETGIAAVCPLPEDVTEAEPLLVEVWPRLGDDVVNGARLPATVALSVLGDAGDDVVRLGAGPDFFNGAAGRDRVWGGAGDDWLRTGADDDRIRGGAGNDLLVGVDGRDRIWGGDGDDRLGGGPGDDRLHGGPGKDHVLCGSGIDGAILDAIDADRDCETVERS